MMDFYNEPFDELEDDNIFSEDDIADPDDETAYPTAEEYNRIHKQKYDYF